MPIQEEQMNIIEMLQDMNKKFKMLIEVICIKYNRYFQWRRLY